MNLRDRVDISYPWNISVFQNVLNEEKLKQYTQEFDSIDWEELFDKESSWHKVNDHELFDFVRNAFGSVPDRMLFKYDTPEHTLQIPHRDKFAKTFQLFLSVDNNALGGTVLYDHFSANMSYELPLLSNSATYFENNFKSWHGVKQRNVTRKSVIFRWNIQ